jgi:acyl carrier protein
VPPAPELRTTREANFMDTTERIRRILCDTLQLGPRANRLGAESQLLGGIPEFDSMAVVTVLTMIEEEFGITVDDDEVSAEVFENLGSLVQFVSRKLQA